MQEIEWGIIWTSIILEVTSGQRKLKTKNIKNIYTYCRYILFKILCIDHFLKSNKILTHNQFIFNHRSNCLLLIFIFWLWSWISLKSINIVYQAWSVIELLAFGLYRFNLISICTLSSTSCTSCLLHCSLILNELKLMTTLPITIAWNHILFFKLKTRTQEWKNSIVWY